MNSHFVGAVIYADDITLLGPTRNSVRALLDICSNYADDHDIIFNPSKTTCIHFPCHQSSFRGKELSFMGTAIKFVSEITFLGISIKNVVKSPSGLYQYQFHIVVLHDSFSRSSHITVV